MIAIGGLMMMRTKQKKMYVLSSFLFEFSRIDREMLDLIRNIITELRINVNPSLMMSLMMPSGFFDATNLCLL